MWYVIQVINGREDVMRERIERMLPASAMQELFYPQFQTEIKVHGEWVNTTKPLFPGYLICDTADPRTVQQYLLRMDDFARVLSQDGQFVPLAKDEVQLIGGFTHRGDRVVPMSEALKDGEQVVVTAGPLLGHEGLIKTINRRKSTAFRKSIEQDEVRVYEALQVGRGACECQPAAFPFQRTQPGDPPGHSRR